MDSGQWTAWNTRTVPRLATTLYQMKTLILLAVVAAIAAVLYKVLTTEIPIDDA